MGWLSGWDKRIELTIDSTKVDTVDLTDFPVLLHISITSGIGDVDASCVFDELTSNDNRKKIAVTTSDGITQCYVEIELWDDVGEEAWLWAKIPSVAYNADTILYLYYDIDHDDNGTYIGDTEETPAKEVWDSNFVGVWHMAQDPNGDVADAIKDSTWNENHGTPEGTMLTADLVTGQIGYGIDFDGTNDAISIEDAADLDITATITVENLIKADLPQAAFISHSSGKYDYQLDYSNDVDANYKGAFVFRDNGAAWNHSDGPGVISASVYHDFVGKYDGTDAESFLDGSVLTTNNVGSKVIGTNAFAFFIGAGSDVAGSADVFFNGIICECRLSNVARSDGWIKATHHSNFDSLITFGAEDVLIEGDVELPSISIAAYALTGSIISGGCILSCLDVSGNTGARGDTTLPFLEVLGEASIGVDAQGNVTLPGLGVVGFTGARCNYNLPSLGVSGTSVAGTVGSGNVVLPIFTVEGQSFTDALVNGDITLPSLRVGASSIHGSLCIGEVSLPSLGISATAKVGVVCTGEVTLPCLIIEGEGGHIPTGDGDVILPLLQVYSTASVLADPEDGCHILRHHRWR